MPAPLGRSLVAGAGRPVATTPHRHGATELLRGCYFTPNFVHRAAYDPVQTVFFGV